MSLIEQAAKRLEQLRQAGVEIPDESSETGLLQAPAAVDDMQAAAARAEISGQSGKAARAPSAAEKPTPSPLPAVHSKRVELDLDAIAASGIVSPHAPRSLISDEYRVIKRPLIDNAMGKGAAPIQNGNLIMVTSALSGEGKSFTAINLAMSIATELDNTVMLIDADVARPSILNMLGLPPAPGFLDALLDDSVDLSSVLLKTNVDKLTILPSGTQHPRATELLASDAMNRLLDDMANRYSDRIIIFDSPPLLMTTESRVLATHMGQIVMVVQAERTLHSEVKQALATIEACPVKLMVLNRATYASAGGYGYGYGYGYGHAA